MEDEEIATGGGVVFGAVGRTCIVCGIILYFLRVLPRAFSQEHPQGGPSWEPLCPRHPLTIMKRIHLLIFGDVQGVGYRAWTRKQARELRVVGWVKNLPASEAGREDKAVELIAEGQQDKLEELVKRCGRGPDVAWVEKVDVTWLPATDEFSVFEVLY